MNKSILLSIKPRYCGEIVSGKKTVEIRKTKPKLETPFKVYIYCTKSRIPYESFGVGGNPHECGGKVIGEFVCDFITNYEAELWDDETFERIQEFYEPDDFNEYGEYEYQTIADNSYDFWKEQHLCKVSCLSIEDLRKYLGLGINKFYGWHISDLVIYDKPKELSEFFRKCDKIGCDDCEHFDYEIINDDEFEFEREYFCGTNGCIPITRPPQSWCYVESEVEQ